MELKDLKKHIERPQAFPRYVLADAIRLAGSKARLPSRLNMAGRLIKRGLETKVIKSIGANGHGCGYYAFVEETTS